MANIGAPYRSELLAPGNGSRSPVGYFLKFDAAMLNREIWRLLACGCRSARSRSRRCSTITRKQLRAHEQGSTIDLRFATMMNDLGLPLRDAHDALNDAVMAGLAFVKLPHLVGDR